MRSTSLGPHIFDSDTSRSTPVEAVREDGAGLLEGLRAVYPAVRGLFALVKDFEAAYTAEKKRRSLLDFSDLDYVKEFDGVWACASLLHVPSAELPRTIMLIHRSLRSDGVLFANFKEGVYGGMRDGRHYTDMTEGRLAELLESKGMVPIEIWTSVDPRGVRWTNSVSRKA